MEILWSMIALLLIINISICSATTYYMKDIYTLESATSSYDNQVTTIDILDRMTIIMDITIYSFPNNEWQNIFHIGNVNEERYPGIWLVNNLDGFHISFSTANTWNDYQNIQIPGNLQLNNKYNVKIEFSQSEYRIYIDNVIQYENVNYPTHSVLTSRSVYIGDPFGSAANALIQNLKIQKIANLCIGEGIITFLRGSSLPYYGEANGKPHWSTKTREHTFIGDSTDIFYENHRGSWLVVDGGIRILLESERGDDVEVDSLYGASWGVPLGTILPSPHWEPPKTSISATLCGWNDSNESQNIYVVSIPYTFIYSFIVIIILVVIIYFIHFIIKKQKQEFIN